MSNLPATPDRLQGALRRVNGALNPRQVFALQWEYAVIVARPGPPVTIDCEAVDTETTAHLPAQLTNLVLWPGPSGFVAQPPPGSIVRVAFVNGDPSKPTVAGLDPNATPLLVFAYASVAIQLGDQSAQPLVHAAWLAAIVAALEGLAAGLAALTTAPLTPISVVGSAFETALGLIPPSPTTKVLAT
jgi:hypothetical protein